MEGAAELSWDIEPNNGRSCFFTQESYEKYCLGPTLAELLLLSKKPAPTEPTQKDSEASVSQAPVTVTKPPVDSSSAKDVPPFPEPRVKYPRFSSLTAFEQDAYVKMMIKYLNNKNTNIAFQQIKEFNFYQFLKSKSSNEVPEFQKFLQNAARSSAEDYDVLCADAGLYIQEMVKACQTYVKNYPPLYTVHEITSILGGKFIPDLTFKLEKCLLKMGSVKFAKITFPSDDIPLPTSYEKVSQLMPPRTKAGHVHADSSSDPIISKLASKYCPQVVLTSQVLFTLLNNHAPGYNEQWEIPVCVKTINAVDGKKCKVVYMDSPLPKKELSTREKSRMFHEVVLDTFMVKNSLISLNTLSLDRDDGNSHLEEHNASRSLPREDKDFETDVTELETFGSEEKDANSKRPLSDSESPEVLPSSLKASLPDKLKLERQIINTSKPDQFCYSSDEVSDVKKQKKNNKEQSDGSWETAHLRTSCTPSSGTQTTTTSDSDSDDRKLVIDIDGKMNERSNMAVTPPVITPNVSKKRKTTRKISKDVDPLGQILKMQTQLLRADTKKTDQTSSVNPEKSEHSTQSAPNVQQIPSRSSLKSQRKVQISQSSNNKYLLPNDLMAVQEDTSEYTVEPEENCAYKMFSLDDILLLLKSTVHTAKTHRTVKKMTKLQIPVFVLTKVNYQTCYGVESLTDSERCRLWTESLTHSKCEMYVGHVDAFTSKFFMLEEITVENLKEGVNTFKPANCLNSLRHILKWVTGFQDGSYLLSHVSGDSSVYLYQSTEDHKRGGYNLHDAHCNAPKAPSSLSVPWVPLNPNLLLKYHILHGRPPCTFPPAPKQDTGVDKLQLNQPRKAPCKENTKGLPPTNAANITMTKKKRSRIQRLKAKQKVWKAEAALQEKR
ncbi:little elongation complex subunit 2 [Anomaloglossus baeobatrachus]|uniref:little elongation complex subunit 2 n=1 Tax=Anomaloglossus baeobatrachus TaxID=238106 RepID=UPI003F500D99